MSQSNPTKISQTSAIKRLFEKLEARREWEAANPEFAADWSEALAIDAEFETQALIHRQRARLQEDLSYQLHKLGVPTRAAQTLQGADQERSGMRAVRTWWADPNPKPLLVLLGGPGSGKTVAAASAAALAASALLQANGDAHATCWVAAAELATMGSFDAQSRDWLERLERCWLLVVDDLGAEALHDHAQARLERLVDVRYGNSRRTVITSNCSTEAFRDRVGARIADRIREAGRVVNCGNTSLRGVRP